MNIEESKSLLGWVSSNKLYIDTHNECDYHNIHTAIETLLTAYEKEKETTDKLKKLNIPVDTLIAEFERLEDLEDDREMLKAELEKEKEKNKELSDKLTEKICKGVEEEILEEYRQIIIDKDKLIEELKKYKKEYKK